MNPPVTVSLTDDIAACLALRRVVFIEEQSVSESEEVDGLDDHALHLLAVQGDTPVGTARLLEKADILKIGRVCVLPQAREQGIGAKLIEQALDVGRVRGMKTALLGSQVHAIAFYERLGFSAHGPEYDDAGILHRDMTCPL